MYKWILSSERSTWSHVGPRKYILIKVVHMMELETNTMPQKDGRDCGSGKTKLRYNKDMRPKHDRYFRCLTITLLVDR